ncbi:2Fe-2S iron-sulfur cluster-binding protein [Variovorax sp. LjRoot84]|uniref:2Fe-2S iron-sulfur cluster-binding protein n=1 Tax=unclassified Variovorax TaxID=663243 RepID=UPI003ED03F8D
MPRFTIIEHTGAEHQVDAEVGQSVMQGAIDALVPGILADCGGSCSCATCHCYVDETWMSRLPPPESTERDMLECVLEQRETSRLSCQLRVTPAIEGLVIRLPASQV